MYLAESKSGNSNEEEDDDDDDDGDGNYLHPSLFATKKSSRLEELMKVEVQPLRNRSGRVEVQGSSESADFC